MGSVYSHDCVLSTSEQSSKTEVNSDENVISLKLSVLYYNSKLHIVNR